jgi:hypothetical protein
LESAIEVRDALFVQEYLPKLREIWIKEGETKATAKVDAELHNTQPPNTTTATDQNVAGKILPGIDQYSKDQKRQGLPPL